MARINPPDAKDMTEKTAGVLREIEGAFGMVPNLFKTYVHYPPLLEANWNKVKAVMMEGKLNRKMKEAIAVLFSMDNTCGYCVAAHSAALKSIGVPDEEIRHIKQQIKKADFNEKEQALIKFARKANLKPLKIKDRDFEALKQTGASDSEIVEALGVMEVFTSFNKFLDSLNVEIDF
jgi:uncharacterized peroxidase-related enzyme